MLIKKELSAVPVAPFPNLGKGSRHTTHSAAVQKVDLPRGGAILCVDFFKIEGEALAARFFSDGKGFLTCTQWPASAWRESAPDLCVTCYEDDVACAEDGLQAAKDFLKPQYLWRHGHDILGVVKAFVSERRDEARKVTRQNKWKLQDKHFAMFPDHPKGLADYCDRQVFGAYVLFDKLDKQGRRPARCTGCGKRHFAPREARNGRRTVCPKCGREAVYKSAWNHCEIEDKAKICIAHKVEGQLLMRWTNVIRKYTGGLDLKKAYDFSDYAYNLHLHTDRGDKVYSYKWQYVMGAYGYDWYRGKLGDICWDTAYIYTENLDRVFGSSYYHVDLKAALEGKKAQLAFAVLLDNLKLYPAAEYFVKMGLLTMAATAGTFRNLQQGEGKPSFASILGVSKQYLPMYREMNVTPGENRMIRDYGKWVTKDDLAACRAVGLPGHSPEKLQKLLKEVSMTRLTRYLLKQKAHHPKKTGDYLLTQYDDYLSMSRGLKVDLSHKSVQFPADVVEAHRQILARYNAVKQEVENEAFAEAVGPIYAGLPLREYERGGLCIVLPMLRSDLITEGQSLNHCVGGENYYRNHIAGTRLIFFVRKIEDRGKPFFTMEVDMEAGRIRQLYGFGDCSAPKEVRAFAEGFVKKLARGAKTERRTA